MAIKDVDKLIDEMSLFEDDLSGVVFNDNIPATELLLSKILGRDIRVTVVKTQVVYRNPNIDKRNIILDIHAIDDDVTHINVEIQCGSKGAHVRRARFHSSAIDVKMAPSSSDMSKLKDSYVIFIYKHDKFRKGLPIYHIDRYVDETGEKFEDGSHIIYVNGKYKGDDDIGKLIHDFYCTKSSDFYYKELQDSVRYYKETTEGRTIMCKAVYEYGKEMKKEGAQKEAAKNVKALMETMKLSLNEAFDALRISASERKIIARSLSK